MYIVGSSVCGGRGGGIGGVIVMSVVWRMGKKERWKEALVEIGRKGEK